MTSLEISLWLMAVVIVGIALGLWLIINEDLDADSKPTEIQKSDDDPWKYGR